AATLAALQVGARTGAVTPGAGVFDLNQLGERVISVWPFRLTSDPLTLILMLGGAYLAQSVLAAVLQYLTRLLALHVQSRMSALMQLDLMRQLLTLSLRFFHKSRTGELASRVVVDADNASSSLGPVFQGILQYGLQTIGLGLYLFK